ncbi:nuclear pore complex protein Nup93-like [Rhopilema esculentum]|uniref:nuclear pore complex protein Nup93-like n=1 Tax=Rhopilema esculentum TaxID=499914 RepID=UPI0031E152DC
MDSMFGDLLQRAEQLTADMDTGGDLPRVERNLPQLAEAGQRLWSKTASSLSEGSDVKASLLLSSKGVELPKLSQRLESLNAAKSFDPIEPVSDTDIQGFLKNERENAILSVIENNKKATFAEADRKFWESITDEWEVEKQKILNSLLSVGKEAMTFPVETEVVDELELGRGRSPMTMIEMAYARQVYICNECLIQGRDCNYLEALKQVVTKVNDKNLEDTWELLKHVILDLPSIARSPLQNRQSREVQAAMVKNAKSFLEDRYLRYVEKTVHDNTQQARLGGIPGTLNLVKSFLKIKLHPATPGLEDGKVDGIPIWALIYYCLRCGDGNAALQAAEGLPPQFSEFRETLKEYFADGNCRLMPSSETKLRMQYKRSIRSSTDHFKRIVFSVIGCCDTMDNHSEVASKSDDYIWLKLQQIGFNDHEINTQDKVSLAKLQSLLLEEFGPSHFKAYQQPFLYCQVLFLTAQFEAGIEFLSTIERLRCHAVHFALVLREAGLLLMPDVIYSGLLSVKPSDPKPMRRLNFARLVMTYTKKFQTTDPREALEYFYLLRNITGANNENVFASCVSELVLETREFEMLLGRLNEDGSRKPGCVEKFNLDTSTIISQVAQDAEAKGQFEDASSLYDLAENHEKVLEILNGRLSQVVSLSSGPHSARERLHTLGVSIASRYKSRGCQASKLRSSTFYLLLDLMYFFDLYHAQEHEQALDTMKKIKLLPFSMESVEQKVTAFRQYSDEIKQCIPDLLLATMNILYAKYCKMRSEEDVTNRSFRKRVESEKQSYLNSLRADARSVVTFAGLLPYRLPGDTNARLVQLEVLMN